jgi:UDP:flavonoid glycosyltransferase YjiC (YdhE family)
MRILITTFGSLGDLYPYIAVAKELQQRGVSVAIASTQDHKPYLDLHGVEFVPMGVNVTDMLEQEPQLMRKIMDRDNGSEYVLRHLVMGNLRRNYDDLMKAIDGVDLLVTHTISYATILVARKKNIPFVGTILSPLNYWSKYDPPVMPGATFMPTLHRMLGTPAVSFVMNRMLPHNLIFRHASAVVHQGGVGTTAQALRAGVPQLIVPWAHDQLDNAARVARLGCGVSVERSQYNSKRAARLVAQICTQPYRTAAQQIGEKIDAERGAENAAIEIINAAKTAVKIDARP